MENVATEADRERLLLMLTGPWVARAIAAAVKMGVLDVLARRPSSVARLADELAVDAESLRRLLRLLAALDILTVTDRADGIDRVEIARLGRLLRDEQRAQSMRAQAVLYDEDYFAGAWSELEAAVRTGEPGFRHAYDKPVFEYLSARPAESARYGAGIAAANTILAEVPHAIDLSDARTIVDVAGGDGALLATILDTCPDADGVLLELPHVLDDAATRLAESGVSHRCTLVGGDFRREVPAAGDVYILSRIMHNWDDETVQQLLDNVAAAIQPGGRLLILERVIPTNRDRLLPLLFDVHMMVMTEGRERTEPEYHTLLAKSGFTPTDLHHLSMGFSILVATKN